MRNTIKKTKFLLLALATFASVGATEITLADGLAGLVIADALDDLNYPKTKYAEDFNKSQNQANTPFVTALITLLDAVKNIETLNSNLKSEVTSHKNPALKLDSLDNYISMKKLIETVKKQKDILIDESIIKIPNNKSEGGIDNIHRIRKLLKDGEVGDVNQKDKITFMKSVTNDSERSSLIFGGNTSAENVVGALIKTLRILQALPLALTQGTITALDQTKVSDMIDEMDTQFAKAKTTKIETYARKYEKIQASKKPQTQQIMQQLPDASQLKEDAYTLYVTKFMETMKPRIDKLKNDINNFVQENSLVNTNFIQLTDQHATELNSLIKTDTALMAAAIDIANDDQNRTSINNGKIQDIMNSYLEKTVATAIEDYLTPMLKNMMNPASDDPQLTGLKAEIGKQTAEWDALREKLGANPEEAYTTFTLLDQKKKDFNDTPVL